MKQKIENFFTEKAVLAVRGAIEASEGCEIFFLGKPDSNKVVEYVEVLARGNSRAAPAIFQTATHGDIVAHNHPGGDLTPSDADVNIAAEFALKGVGFYIIDNSAKHINVVVKLFDKKQTRKLNVNELKSVFEEGGFLGRKLKGFEVRKQQTDMLENVANSFNNNKISIIEAGTGTGKSLAYLLPSVYWSVNNQERVVVSTNTINLQEQLISKDIPILKRSLPLKFKAVLIKGRNNYACLRKAGCLREDGQLLLETAGNQQLVQLLNWMNKTNDGSREDLAFTVAPDVWEMVQCEDDQCSRVKCPFFTKCFFYSARREAASADILVANHHLLVADIGLRKAMDNYSATTILPPFKKVVIDEAHNIEEVFTSCFGVNITIYRILKTLRRLQSSKEASRGLFSYLVFKLQKERLLIDPNQAWDIEKFINEKALPAWDELHTFSLETFSSMAETIVLRLKVDLSQNEELKTRIDEKFVKNPLWECDIIKPIRALIEKFYRFIPVLNQLLAKVKYLPDKAQVKFASIKLDIKSCKGRLQSVADDMAVFIEPVNFEKKDEAMLCRWFEIKNGKNGKAIKFCHTPINISKDMKSYVYDKFDTIVLTSATLAINKNFNFFKQRTGLDLVNANKLAEKYLESPFDYEHQSFVGVPIDIAYPNEGPFAGDLKRLILQSITTSGGKALVLFTSYSLLSSVFNGLQRQIASLGYTCLRQGDDSRHRLLESFKKDKTSILFATDSFWQGIDVKGDALECVIVTKLPFRVPTEPIVQARADYIKQQGGDPFNEYALPIAAIKFKQGFGRLIRSREDRGAVLIFDKRIATKGYGSMFLNSLPKVHTTKDRTEMVFKEMEEFFQKE